MPSEFDIEPCPFCHDSRPYMAYVGLSWYVKCGNEPVRGVSGPMRSTPEKAASVWNIPPFQSRVKPWLFSCIGETIALDKTERNDRFGEEALEVLQAAGCGRDRMHALVDYVCDRAKGDLPQEIGGAMVTLASLAIVHGLDIHHCAEVELERIQDPEVIQKIRAKQETKPTGDALMEKYGNTIRVPKEPPEAMWGGLARQLVMWTDMNPRTPRALFKHLRRAGYEIPQWLLDEPEMKNLDHVPSKGTRAVLIYKAMIHTLDEEPVFNESAVFFIEHKEHFIWIAETEGTEDKKFYMTHDFSGAKSFSSQAEAQTFCDVHEVNNDWSIVSKEIP